MAGQRLEWRKDLQSVAELCQKVNLLATGCGTLKLTYANRRIWLRIDSECSSIMRDD